MIYFIATPDRSRIKIGTTIRLSARLSQLIREHGEGLEVLAVTEGSYEAEKELHRRFSHLNVVNEWFEPGDDLVGFIVAEGRPWDGIDEAPPPTRPGTPVRIDADLAEKARYLAAFKRVSMTDYLSGILRPALEKDEKEAGKKMIGGGDK